MNLKKLKENLENTIRGKELLTKHLLREGSTVDKITVSFLDANINELRLILLDVQECIESPDEL
jgi:hypothetical protein